jgi:hypothetical protein
MLTKMTEEDWVLVLEVFHACRSRRGDKGRVAVVPSYRSPSNDQHI